jgi:hypothetical protein
MGGHGHYTGPSEPLHPLTPADVQYMSTPEGSGYEHTDANVWQIVKFGIWLVITAVVVHIGMGGMYMMLIEQAKVTGEQPYPLAATSGARLPPEPQLQQFPRNDYYRHYLAEQQKLHGYGWVNKEAGVVHIPIEEAMRLAVERGLVQSSPQQTSPETPGLMPSDSSSGRVMERRRQ